MSAPCDKDRAWRSCGTANEASWQNSDFSIDHRLKTEETEAQMSLKELAQLKAVNECMHEFSVFSACSLDTPRDEHLLLDVSQKLRVILTGEV